jgi:hypothetical protein
LSSLPTTLQLQPAYLALEELYAAWLLLDPAVVLDAIT